MNIKKILSTILVILWMITIFNFSNQQGYGSSSTSKKATMIIVNILDIRGKMQYKERQKIVQIMEPAIRKLAHYSLYILGGILIMNCISMYKIANIKKIYCSAIIGIIYAISDELHQLFINGRSGKVEDVIIDSIGIFTGLVIYIFIARTINIIKAKSKLLERGN